MKIGDLVRMVPKNYSSHGIHVPDQWKGLIGVITEEHIDDPWDGRSFSVFIKHPDESAPNEIYASEGDIEVINENR